MAVIRVNKTGDYTVMSNAHFKVKEMSLKAKGLLSLMLSLPDTWDYSIAGLCAICKENQSAIKSTLDELKKFGFLVVTKHMPNETDSGRIEYEYNIYERPQKQAAEKQGTESLPLECQTVENPRQLNTNQFNTNQSNTKKANTDNKDISTEFEKLWKLYPRKVGKPKALKAYERARKKGTTFDEVEQGIKAYCRQIEGLNTEAEYIKHGSTWFNGECWKDDYSFTPRRTYGANGIAVDQNAPDDLAGIF